MSYTSAVFLFAAVRVLLAGYGGSWFLPVVLGEAADAALPFLCVAAGHGILRRLGRGEDDPAERIMHITVWVMLFVRFGAPWLETQAPASGILTGSTGLSFTLIGGGLAAGALTDRLAGPRRALRRALTAGAAGWLILGPQLYLGFDHIFLVPRAIAVSAITALFLVLTASFVVIGRAGGARVLERLLLVAATGAIAAAAVWPNPSHDVELAEGAPSVLLVVVDTLRADMLDVVDENGVALMPRTRELAARGTRFTQAIAPSPWTLPSAVSIMTGFNPHRHEVGVSIGRIALPADRSPFFLGRLLRSKGFQVAAFVNNPYIRPYYGFGEAHLRFRRYVGTAKDGVRLAAGWMAKHSARPSFVLLHLMDPHWPYDAPHGFGPARGNCESCDDLVTMQYHTRDPEHRAEVRRRYEAEVAFTDYQVGRLIDRLEAHDAFKNTWLVLTSDHGEEFWDHDRFLHGHSLFDELLRVPLIVVPPRGERGLTVDRQVRLEDIVPTVLDAVGVDAAEVSVIPDGRSLMPYLSAESAAGQAERPVVAGFVRADDGPLYAVREERYKLIDWPRVGVRRLMSLEHDPGENGNVLYGRPKHMKRLLAVPGRLGLDPNRFAELRERATEGRLDPGLERELRSLGYLGE